MPGVCLRLCTYPRSQLLHTDRGRCHVLCASLAARFLDQPGPLARPGSLPIVACSWRRPFALPKVLHSAEPSGLPLTQVACASLLRGLSPRGQEGLHLFRCIPSLRAAVIAPSELAAVINLFPRTFECCLPHPSSGSASAFVVTRLARRSIPAARSVAPRLSRVCRRAPRRALATPARPPCLLAVVPC